MYFLLRPAAGARTFIGNLDGAVATPVEPRCDSFQQMFRWPWPLDSFRTDRVRGIAISTAVHSLLIGAWMSVPPPVEELEPPAVLEYLKRDESTSSCRSAKRVSVFPKGITLPDAVALMGRPVCPRVMRCRPAARPRMRAGLR